MIKAQVDDLSFYTTKYSSLALTQKVFANMKRVGKGFSRVETLLFKGMIVPQQAAADVDSVVNDDVAAADVPAADAGPTPPSLPPTITPPPPPQELPSTSQVVPTPPSSPLAQSSSPPQHNNLHNLPLSPWIFYKKVREEEKVDSFWVEKIKKGGIIAKIDADEDVILEEVDAENDAKVVKKDANVQERPEESQAQMYKIDLEHADKVLKVVTAATTPITAATITAAPSAARRRKGVVIRDPEETAAPSIIIHTESKSKDKGKEIMVEEPKPLKKQAQIHKEQLEEEESRALKRQRESLEEKATKKQMLDEEVEELKKHIQIVLNDDDVYTKATPLALKVPVVDYEIYSENNKPFYKIIRADESHQLFLRFLSVLKNFDREDLEMLWQIVQERFASSKPKNFLDDFLLTTLTYMFEKPDVEAQVWKNQRNDLAGREKISINKVYFGSGDEQWGFIDKFVRDPNKTPDSSQRPLHNSPKCGNPVDGLYCGQCALLRKKLKEVWFTICDENDIFLDFLNTFESSNDNTNVVNALQEPFVFNQDPSENSSQNPPHIDHHCCYGYGDSLDGIFCQRCTCESCGNGAHIGYNCPLKVSIISNPEPCHNQNVDEFPHTLPSFHPTCYSGDENSFAYDSTRNFVDDSPNVFNPPPQPPTDSYEFCGNDAHYGHDCPPQDYTIAITPVLSTEEPLHFLIIEDEHLDTIPATELDEVIKSSVEDLVPIPSDSEGIPDNMCDVPFRDNSPPLDISKDQFKDFSNSNDDSTSVDDDYFSIDDIDYVEASPPDSELVNLEEVEDDILREKLLNIRLLIAKIESLNDNPTPDRVLKSPSLFPILTFSNHTEETNSGSTTTHADYSLPEYDSFIFEIKPDQGELTSVVMEDILGEHRVYVHNVLPTHPTLYLDLNFLPLDDSLGSDLEVSFPSRTRNKIFDPGIFEFQPKNFLSRDTFYISFIRDPLCPLIETLLLFLSENEDQVFNPEGTFLSWMCRFSISIPLDQLKYGGSSQAQDSVNKRSLIVFFFFETPKVLLLAWDRVSEIKDAFGNKQYKSEDIQELIQKLFNDVQNIHEELAEYINTPSWNRHAFYNYDDDDDGDYTIAITPVLSTEEPADSLIMEDEHLDTISATKSDEVIKSSVEDLVPIPSESEGIPDKMCDVPFHDNSPPLDISKDQFEDFSDSNDDSTSIDDDYFSIDDIDYVEASPPDAELVSLEEVKDDILREKLLNIHLLIAKIESLNDNPTPDRVLKFLPHFLSPLRIVTLSLISLILLYLIRIILYPNLRRLAIIRKRRVVAVPLLLLITLFPMIETLLLFSSENEEQVFNPSILSSNLLSHRGKITFDFSENPMMISGGDIPFLDVPFLHLYPPRQAQV
nr:hypothetical protein [Tanacetum cinerariifolium]